MSDTPVSPSSGTSDAGASSVGASLDTAGGATIAAAATPEPIATGVAIPATLMRTEPATAPALPWAAAAEVAIWAPARMGTPRNGIWAIHAASPAVQRSLPTEMFMKPRTTTGSKWVPVHALSSCRASAGDLGRP